ncbi:ATP/GTP-binding protein [Streptomyces sp. ADI95-17]|uniref:ATP/GTP-binding protein n=1 Tax=Streptomyces sp. ADI95-17 TaxID=1522759 RepID=UPI000FAB23AF|nr:ATP/GTP-binding protein [Streptomyces sp. ADI95-17]RPK55816.1 hypothetical protein EES42_41720 [Streptomyces sp. ADI95-17]
MLRRAALAALALCASLPSVAFADDGPGGHTVGNSKNCAGTAFTITTCAQDRHTAPGSSGAKPSARKASSGGSSDAPKCSYTKMVPQPPPENLAMQDGKEQGGKGAVYQVNCPATDRIGTVWIPEGKNPAEPAVDPEVVARQAVDSMKLDVPDIDINPKPGGRGLVGMPVWMAVDRSATTYGPISASATAGNVTVTATAKVAKIVWSMGDGAVVTCTSPGSVYKKSYGMKASPDCGHVYKQASDSVPGGKFRVTATATWAVNWQVAGGSGETGQLTEVRSSQVALTIVESQAVNQ